MKLLWNFAGLLLLTIFVMGCRVLGLPYSVLPTPPGWRSPVEKLLLDESDLPKGWLIDFTYPQDLFNDPTINHVSREFWNPDKGSGQIAQSIWRAYTLADAQAKYADLRGSQFAPSRPLYPGTIFVPFEPPVPNDLRSKTADEFYLACGWWGPAYCEVVARYRNYVVELRLDQEAEHEGNVTHGLTQIQVGAAVTAMDVKFAEFLKSLTLGTSTP